MTKIIKVTAKTEAELAAKIAAISNIVKVGKKEGFTNKKGAIVRWEQNVFVPKELGEPSHNSWHC